jgi:hypothetical protein
MADYEKLRRKRDAADMVRADIAREERRKREQVDRDKARKDQERRHWEQLAMEKTKQRQKDETAVAEARSQEMLKTLEEKKAREIDAQLQQLAQRQQAQQSGNNP